MKTTMLKLRFLFLLCSAIAFVEGSKPPHCGPDEIWTDCLDPCKTCKNKDCKDCIHPCKTCKVEDCKECKDCKHHKDCKPGCECKGDLYRNCDGKCVPACECDGPVVPTRCRPDEVYKKCGCYIDCCNLKNPWACKNQCLTGCFCRPPLVRNADGKCIKPSDCPCKAECGKNEVYKSCGPAVEPTCDNCNPPTCKKCVKGCFCKDGYVRNKHGDCIPKCQCPKIHCPGIECRPGCYLDIHHKPCPNCFCPVNCQGIECRPGCYIDIKRKPCPQCYCPPDFCPSIKCPKGCYVDIENKPCPNCYCPEDPCPDIKCPKHCWLDKNHKPHPKCICPEDKCGKNEVYKSCGPAIEPTCDNCNPTCDKPCVKGCFCKDGYVRDKHGDCIPKCQCPNRGEYADYGDMEY